MALLFSFLFMLKSTFEGPAGLLFHTINYRFNLIARLEVLFFAIVRVPEPELYAI